MSYLHTWWPVTQAKAVRRMGRKKATPSTPVPVAEQEETRFKLLEDKMDKMMEMMVGFNERLHKQEEKSMSPVPSAHSSAVGEEDKGSLPSFQELKGDSRIQAEIRKRLHDYDYTSRLEHRGRLTDALKSGRFRTGSHKVRHIISWPQDFCTILAGGKQPTYDELSPMQWSQGIVATALEEKDPIIRENMLKYFISIAQDAIEVSFPTARRAHGILLQEIEKGVCTWKDFDLVEKIRSRNTQRFASPVGNVKQNPEVVDKNFICKLYNKGTCRSEKTEHTEKGINYQHFCSHCFSACGKKFEHPRTQCLRLK